MRIHINEKQLYSLMNRIIIDHYGHDLVMKKNDDGESVKGAKDSRKTGDEILILKSSYTPWQPVVQNTQLKVAKSKKIKTIQMGNPNLLEFT